MVDPNGINLFVMAKADEESGIDSCFTGVGVRVAGSLLWLVPILPLQKFSG